MGNPTPNPNPNPNTLTLNFAPDAVVCGAHRWHGPPLTLTLTLTLTLNLNLNLTLTFGKVGNLCYDSMRYDTFFRCAIIQCFQMKVSKVKIVALIAGFSRHCCWLTSWADELVLNDKNVYDTEQSCWVVPEVHGAN